MFSKICSMLLATDGSEACFGAERIALKIAERCGAKLFVLNVVYYNPEHMSIAIEEVETQKSRAREVVERVKREAIERDIDVETKIILSDSIEEGIAKTAEEVQANLIVMGRRGIRGLAKLLIGSATIGVVPIAPCPVLIVPRNADLRGKGFLGATDGSEVSLKAVDFMCELAQRMDLPLYVLAVAKDLTFKEKAEEALEKAREILKRYNLNGEFLLYVGEPSRLILEVAKQRDIDLIVMGNRGLKGISKMIFGSVSEKVLNNTDRGVLIVKN